MVELVALIQRVGKTSKDLVGGLRLLQSLGWATWEMLRRQGLHRDVALGGTQEALASAEDVADVSQGIIDSLDFKLELEVDDGVGLGGECLGAGE